MVYLVSGLHLLLEMMTVACQLSYPSLTVGEVEWVDVRALPRVMMLCQHSQVCVVELLVIIDLHKGANLSLVELPRSEGPSMRFLRISS